MRKIGLFLASKKNFEETLGRTNGNDMVCCKVCKFRSLKLCKKICKHSATLYDDFLESRGENSKEHSIVYVTERGYVYRIVYRKIGFCLWEWDICVKQSAKEDDWLGLTFNEEKALFHKSKMANILVGYAEWKDGENEKLGLNLNSYNVKRG